MCKYRMGESGGLLSSGDMSLQRSYGAVRSQNIMLTCIDSKLFSHKLEPSDTLQGLAIKYGISVERLKRVNKLWSNDSIHIKDSLLIPCSKESPDMSIEPCASLDSFNVLSDEENEFNKSTEISENNTENNDDLNSSCKENREHLANNAYNTENYKSDAVKSYDSIFSKIDGQIKVYKESVQHQVGSDAYNSFNEMLSKIDTQIQNHKSKNPEPSTDIPSVAYDGGYQNVTFHNSYTPPPKQHSILEQGI